MADVRPSAATNFASRVITWQKANGRHDLPWQQTRDAYSIWLSEIMLQQTQVNTVIPYYGRFLVRFPSLEALAEAPLGSVLESWSGLGYYARARNLHRCAQELLARHASGFSGDPEEDAALPGIGRSTAAAISVFAFGRRAAILDGNVKRVLARCFGIESGHSSARDERKLWGLAESLLPASEIEAYTQGLMDLGATVCTGRAPACAACPLKDICVACRDDRQSELLGRRTRKPVPQRASSALLLTDGRRVLLERRPPSGIWGGLLALPERVGESADTFALRHGCRLLSTRSLPPITHAFTHFRLTIDVLRCDAEVFGQSATEPTWEWLPFEDVAAAALPAPIKKLLLSTCPVTLIR
jgi:A/G-specific adenine glycosylase